MAQNINRVVLTGNLTRDPELRTSKGGTAICTLRVASNARKRNGEGEWVDKPNFIDVTLFGAQAENAAAYLAKGRAVAIDGRLDWSEWEDADGKRRQALAVLAQSVQFLGSPSGENKAGKAERPPQSDLVTAGAGGSDDDIPF